jgi:hypothetical protein
VAEQVGNLQMAQVHARTGWSRKELARRVNQRARLRGVHLHTDASRVRHWLDGQHPQPPVPELLSELFSEELGYPITPVDIGLPATDEHELGLRYLDSIAATVVAVAELGRYDMRRRNLLRNGTYLAVATVAPSRDWLLAVLDATEPRPLGRVALAQVLTIRDAFSVFQEADVIHGGGHARAALAEYLTTRVLPLLHHADPDSEAGAALFAAASEQTYLLGWMAIDDDRQALAQRYLIQALRLAQESGDAALGAHVLAGMSHQALMMNHPREALRLATTGRHGLTKAYSAACASRLLALEAGAHAALGDATAASRAVAESERAFESINAETEPEWARFIDSAYLSGEWANTFASLHQSAETTRCARRSIAEASQHRRARREVFSPDRAGPSRPGTPRPRLGAAGRPPRHRSVDHRAVLALPLRRK